MSHLLNDRRHQLVLLLLVLLQGAVSLQTLTAAVVPPKQDETQSSRLAHLVRVRLPIDDLVSREVRQTLNRIAEKSQRTVRPENRPLVVLEFDTASGRSGRGSELEACQAIARDMTDVRLNGIETIAYIPQSNSVAADPDPDALGSKGSLVGHAVLVAIAANKLAMEPGTMIGKAGADESRIEKLQRIVYETIAERRLTLPLPIVMGMLDPGREVIRVRQVGKNAVYVGSDELRELETTQVIEESSTVSKAGAPLVMGAEELFKYRLISLVPESKNDLAQKLGVNIASLESDPTNGGDWTAIQIPLPFNVDEKATTWIIDKVNQRVADGANLVILTIDESDGKTEACIELAQRLAEFKERDVRTVAFVRGRAQGPVAVVALACDHLIMSPSSRIGGYLPEQIDRLDPDEIERLIPLLENVSRATGRGWSMPLAMLDPGMTVTSYRAKKSGQQRLLGEEELRSLENPEDWRPNRVLGMSDGLTAETAEQLSLARLVAEDMGQLQTFYQLAESPELVELRASERWLDRFAQFLRSPLISMLLLMGTFLFLSNELSAPGLGVPGFLALVCVSLYFWSMYLGGSAAWFEILMFAIGVICIGLEIAVLPGFGIFGVGGILLIGISLVLSAQTFVIPSTVSEIKQLPYSLLPVVGAGLGMVAGVWTLSKALPNSKYFRKFMINRREREETGLEDVKDPEAMVDWSFLQGETGETMTRLNPAGKVKIKGRMYDVISTGQLIDKGQRVDVVEAIGNRIVVQTENAG